MRDRIKRTLALMLALVMVVCSVVTDGFTFARAEGPGGANAVVEVTNFKAVAEAAEQAHGVALDSLTLTVTATNADDSEDKKTWETKIKEDRTILEVVYNTDETKKYNYTYTLSSTDYVITSDSVLEFETTGEGDEAVTSADIELKEAKPNYTLGTSVTGSDTLEVGVAGTYEVEFTGSDVWKNKIVWSGIEGVVGNGTTCTVTAPAALDADTVPATLCAAIDSDVATKDITFSKKEITGLSISATGTWADFIVTVTGPVELVGKEITLRYNGLYLNQEMVAEDEVAKAHYRFNSDTQGDDYVFSASYAGDDIYKAAKVENVPITLGSVAQTIKVTPIENVTVTYGDSIAVATVESTGITEDIQYEVSVSDGMGSGEVVDGQLIYTPAKSGTATITVKKLGNGAYSEVISDPITVTVNKAEISIDQSTVVATGKTYDGTPRVEVDAFVTASELVGAEKGGKGFAVTNSSAEAKSADAGTQDVKDAVLTIVDDAMVEKYTLADEGKVSTTVEIEPATLHLQIGSLKTEWYNSSSEEKLEELANEQLKKDPTMLTVTGFIDNQKPEGFENPEIVLKEKLIRSSEEYYEKLLWIKAETGKATDNYSFCSGENCSSCKMGAIVLVHDKNTAKEYLKIDTCKNVYEKESGQYYYGVDAKVKFKIVNEIGDTNESYTKIIDKDGKDITESEINPADLTDGILSLRLQDNNGFGQDSLTEFVFKSDEKAPNITISEPNSNKDSTIKSFLNAIMFKFFSKTSDMVDTVTVNVQVDDGQGGSGVADPWSYIVVNPESDTRFDAETISEQDVITMFFGAGSEKTFIPSTAETIEIDANANNYIVFVSATDNVGNNIICSSKGFVLEDVQLNEIELTYDVPVNAKIPEENGVHYFDSNVSINVEVKDNSENVFYSGVKEIFYKLNVNGEEIENPENSKHCVELSDAGMTLDQLKDSIKHKFEFLDNDKKSQKIVASFYATDRAGNTAINNGISKTFVLDSIKPVLKDFVIDNARDNGFYNEAVTLKFTVVERFLDDVILTITMDGTETKGIYLKDLVTNEKLKTKFGITDVTFAPEDGDDDSKETPVVITFGAPDADENNGTNDHEFKVEITNILDKSGNDVLDKSGNDAAEDSDNCLDDYVKEFVIDTTNPVADIIYSTVGTDEALDAGTVKEAPAYVNGDYSGFKAVLQVTELNFSSGETVAGTYSMSAVDAYDKDVDGAIADNAAGDANVYEKWVPVGTNVYQYELDFSKDANYAFGYEYEDLAGNPVTIAPEYITLDRTKPEGTITVEGLTNTDTNEGKLDTEKKGVVTWLQYFFASITFGVFGQDEANATMTSKDNLSGVASTEYYVSYNEYMNENVLENLDKNGGIKWNAYDNTSIPIEKDKGVVVYQKVKDIAGNIGYYSSESFITDKTNPDAPTITITSTNNGKPSWKDGIYGIYRAEDTPGFKVEVTEPMSVDPNGKESYAGLKKITYEICDATDDSKKVNGVLFDAEKNNEKIHQVQTWPGTNNEYITDSYVTIDTNIFNSNRVAVKVMAVDWSGNQNEKTIELAIDTDAPIVELEFDKSGVKNEKYYSVDQKVLTITVDERNFDTTYVPLIDPETGKYEVSDWKLVDGKYECTVTFTGEGDYNVTFSCNDLAGNPFVYKNDASKELAQYITDFTIDRTNPEAKFIYYSYGAAGNEFKSGTDKDAPAYLGELYASFKTVLQITEINFSNGETVAGTYTMSAVDAYDKVVAGAIADNAAGDANVYEKWVPVGTNVYQYELDFSKDANYAFGYVYEDLAGNPVTIKTEYVTLDKTKPTGTVTVNGFVNGEVEKTWVEHFLSGISFGLFGNTSANSTMTSDDATAGVASTEYYVANTFLTREDLAKVTAWTTYGNGISISANNNTIVYQKVTDKAGNVEYYSSESFVMDDVDPAPIVTITPSSPAWGKGVYSASDNPGFDIVVTDPITNDSYSGLREVTYRIVNGTTGAEETGTLIAYTNTEHVQSWTGHVGINPEIFYSNDVQITVTASDWSTNEATSETAALKVDNKAPVVTFSFDTSDVLNGKYYKNNKTLTITVDERNFDPAYLPTVTSTAGGGYSFSGWTTNGEISTGVITFTGDSDYTVTFDCYDLAGNKSNTATQDEFTVDKTMPVINVTYDNNSVQNGNYYQDDRTAAITIIEHNFNAGDVTSMITASDGTVPSVSGWTTSGDTHTAVVSFKNDAVYTFDIDFVDLAGNNAADYVKDEFVIDLTTPSLSITGVEDKSANNGTVAPSISMSDTNFNYDSVTVTLKGANRGDMDISGMASVTSTADGQLITFSNFADDLDDIYKLTAKVVDKAGNEIIKSIEFSVNRDGSTYNVVQSNDAFTKEPVSVVVEEINVNTLKEIEISYSKDGSIVTLEEGEDYTVKVEGGEGQWKKYTYTINASCFTDEGAYIINISSTDEATNMSNNKVQSKNIEFVVDRTAPSVAISNLIEGKTYNVDSHQFTLNVKDNTTLSYVELYMDGELVHTYKGEELTVENGKLYIDINKKDAKQNIKIIAYDEAGNPTEPIECGVWVTTNWWINFYNNKPLLFGSIGSLLALIFVIIFIIVKRKKDDEEQKTAKK